MTCFIGAAIIFGVVIGGVMLYLKTDRLDREIRSQQDEPRRR